MDQAQLIAQKLINPSQPRTQFTDPSQAFKEALARSRSGVKEAEQIASNLVNRSAEKFGQLTDLKLQAGAGPDETYQPIAQQAFKSVADYVTPSPSNFLLNKVAPASVAASMIKKNEKSAAELYRDAKAGLKSAFGTVVVKDTAPKIGTVTVKP